MILPSVVHACAVWFHTSEADLKILESIQYRAAKAVIKINQIQHVVHC